MKLFSVVQQQSRMFQSLNARMLRNQPMVSNKTQTNYFRNNVNSQLIYNSFLARAFGSKYLLSAEACLRQDHAAGTFGDFL